MRVRSYVRGSRPCLRDGRGPAVIQQRMECQELMRDRFIVVIERATGQRVIGLRGRKPAISPDIMCEVSMLALTDLIDEHGPDAAGLQTSDR